MLCRYFTLALVSRADNGIGIDFPALVASDQSNLFAGIAYRTVARLANVLMVGAITHFGGFLGICDFE